MSADTHAIPTPTLRRMPSYLDRLREALGDGQETLSCSIIAHDLKLTDTQVRKDLALTGATGRPRIGYPVRETIAAIENYLGWKNTTEAFLVGCGNLGSALLGYGGFGDSGLEIVAAFDADRTRIGKQVHGRKVMAMSRLPNLVRRMGITIAVLTIPGRVAQNVAEDLVAAGIRAIWNFTPTTLNLGPEVVVEDVRLDASLASLTARLRALLAT